MNQTHNLQALAKLLKTIDFNDFVEEYTTIKAEHTLLTEKVKKLESHNMKLVETNTMLNNELETITEKLQSKTDDVTNLTKVSIVQTLSKQVDEKNNMIRILESQLEKYKSKKVENTSEKELKEIELVVEEKPKKHPEVVIEEKPKNQQEVVVEEKSKKQTKTTDDFDPDNFEDINGYELMMYKKKYYLRDLETNELYTIVNNKQDKVIGFINSSGKPKFN